MSFFRCSQQQRQIQMLKKNRMQSVLNYNLQQMNRRQKQRHDQEQSIRYNSQVMNQEALEYLLSQKRRRENKRVEERNRLKEIYEKQMKEKEERIKIQKNIQANLYQQQLNQLEYQEHRRMAELAKMYNRNTYQAVPYDSHRRLRTEEIQRHQTSFEMPKTPYEHGRRHDQIKSLELKQARKPGSIMQSNQNNQPNQIRDSLDNLNIENINYPSRKQTINQAG